MPRAEQSMADKSRHGFPRHEKSHFAVAVGESDDVGFGQQGLNALSPATSGMQGVADLDG